MCIEDCKMDLQSMISTEIMNMVTTLSEGYQIPEPINRLQYILYFTKQGCDKLKNFKKEIIFKNSEENKENNESYNNDKDLIDENVTSYGLCTDLINYLS